MKPIHLNLSARPYRDYRPVYAAVVVMSLLTAFLMLNNVETYYRYIHETRSTRAKIAAVSAQAVREKQNAQLAQQRLESIDVARLDAQTKFINAKLAERAFSWSALLDQLETIDVERLDAQTKFINAKLAERAFSWSALLDQLENILPEDVRLDSVSPRFTDAGPINLSLSFAAKDGQGLIDTINSMHGDPHFRNPFPSSETRTPRGFRFNLTVQYLPDSLTMSQATAVKR